MASIPPTDPDPRTAADDDEDATDQGVSSTAPAEGSDDAPDAGSARG